MERPTTSDDARPTFRGRSILASIRVLLTNADFSGTRATALRTGQANPHLSHCARTDHSPQHNRSTPNLAGTAVLRWPFSCFRFGANLEPALLGGSCLSLSTSAYRPAAGVNNVAAPHASGAVSTFGPPTPPPDLRGTRGHLPRARKYAAPARAYRVLPASSIA